MKRTLAWSIGAVAVAALGAFLALRVAPSQRPADPPSTVAAATPAPPTPALASSSAPAAPSAGAGEGSGVAAGESAPAAQVALPPALVAASAAAEAQRNEYAEQARALREDVELRVAELRERRAAALAGRPPDPDRPPPDRTPLKLGPGIIPGSLDEQ